MAEKALSILKYFLHGLNVLTVGLISAIIALMLLLIFVITCFSLIVSLAFTYMVSQVFEICISMAPFLFVGFGSIAHSPIFLFAGLFSIVSFLIFRKFRMVVLNMIFYPTIKFLPLVVDCARKSGLHMQRIQRIILLSVDLISIPYEYFKK